MNPESVTVLVAAIAAFFTGLSGLVVAVFSGMATRRQQLASAAQQKVENEAIAKGVADELKKAQEDMSVKMEDIEKRSDEKMEIIHKTFNSRMEQAMKDLQDKFYAKGLKDGQEEARIALERAAKHEPNEADVFPKS